MIPLRTRTPSNKHTSLWMSHLALLVRSGIPIATALSLLGSQTRSAALRDATSALRLSILEGHPLSQSMALRPTVFSPFMLAVISAGERSGSLEHALGLLSDYLKEAHVLRARFVRAAIYPTMVILTLMAVTTFLLVWVIPSFEDLFSESAVALPRLTQMVIASSRVSVRYGGPSIAVLLVILLLITHLMTRAPRALLVAHRILLSLPLVGATLRNRHTSDCMTLLACLVRAGIPVTTALEALIENPHNSLVTMDLTRIHAELLNGASLSQSFMHSRVFSGIALHLIGIGESTGRLDEMLAQAGAACREELEAALEALKQLAEPCLILSVGAIVTIIVLAIYLPIFELGAVSGLGP